MEWLVIFWCIIAMLVGAMIFIFSMTADTTKNAVVGAIVGAIIFCSALYGLIVTVKDMLPDDYHQQNTCQR